MSKEYYQPIIELDATLPALIIIVALIITQTLPVKAVSDPSKTTYQSTKDLKQPTTSDQQSTSNKNEVSTVEEQTQNKESSNTSAVVPKVDNTASALIPNNTLHFPGGITGKDLPQNDESTGALTYSFSIPVPPGRNDMQPNLQLNYNNQLQNAPSLLGAGWSVNIPSIQRINKNGSNKLFSESYFSSLLSGELVMLSPESFAPKVDNGEFLKYTFTNNVWTVVDKKGSVYTFGAAAEQRQDDQSNPNQVFKWMLSSIRDTNNNFIRYTYLKHQGQIYPDTLFYTGNGNADGIFTIKFELQAREDIATSYATGFAVATAYRLSQITATINGAWVRRYTLNYTDGDNGSRSLLTSVVESGKDTVGNILSLPPTSFSYQTPNHGWQINTAWSIPIPTMNPSIAHPDNGFRIADLNGDGLPDIFRKLRIGTCADIAGEVYINNGNGWTLDSSWQVPLNTADYCSGQDSGTRIADINGDGLPDLFIYIEYPNIPPYKYVFLNNGHGWTVAPNWQVPIPTIRYGASYSDFGTRVADVNGDGLPDLVGFQSYSGGNPFKFVYLNTGAGWALDPSWDIPIPTVEYNAPGTNSGTQIADVNGDGLPDMFRYIRYPNSPDFQQVFLNNGHGWVSAPSWSFPIPTADYTAPSGSTGAQFADINGDGLLDIFRKVRFYNCNDQPNEVWLNTGHGWVSDNSWQIPIHTIDYCSAVDPGSKMADIDGDGLADIIRKQLYSNGTEGPSEVYINKAYKVDLLAAITYSSGGQVTISYKSTPQYRSGTISLNPSLFLVLDTVEKLTYFDPVTDVTSFQTYSYEAGSYYYNPANVFDRQFAGFGKIIKTNAAGTKITTSFHQGNVTNNSLGEYSDHISKAGKPYRVEWLNSTNSLYTAVINKWDRTDLGNGCSFIKLVQQLNMNYDGSSMHRDIATTFIYDNNGNVTEQKNWGEVSGAADGTFTDCGNCGNDGFTTTTSYISNPTKNIYGLPTQITLTSQNNEKVSETRYYYDGLVLGQANAGNVTKQEGWISGTSYNATQKSYNVFGMVIQELDPRNQPTSYTYDSYNLYPISSKNALNHTTHYTYNYSTGRVAQITNPNGGIQKTRYDGLGRPTIIEQTESVSPTALVSTTAFEYVDAPLNTSIHESKFLDASTKVDNYTYFDGFDRILQTRNSGKNANVYVVTDYAYNNVGQLEHRSLPYFSNGVGRTSATTNSNLYTVYGYDPLLRVLSSQTAVGTTTASYNQWVQSIIDPKGNRKDLIHDAYGRLVSVKEYNQGQVYVTKYTYNGSTCLTSIIDAQGNIRNFVYDGLQRRVSAQDLHNPTDATFGTWIFTYDNAGNLITKKDPNSQTVNYSYDELNRVKTENIFGQNATTYIYDTCANGVGKLCAVTQAAFEETYAYDLLGRIVQNTRTIATKQYKTQINYDRQGDQTLVTNPDNSQIRYIYNSAGLLNQVQRKESTETIFVDVITNVDYSPKEQPTSINYANGTTTINTYDANRLYRLTHKVTTSTQTGTPRFPFLELLDNDGATTQQRVPNINPNAATKPIIASFSATPISVASGETVTLAWTLSGGKPTSLTIDNNIGSVLGSTNKTIYPDTTKIYTLTASNESGTSTKQTIVAVTGAATPTISPNGGNFTSPVTVTLTSPTTGATIHYTTNGTLPTTASAQYTSPFTLSVPTTVKAIAVKTGIAQSSVVSASFTIGDSQSKVVSPLISPNGGNFNSSQAIALSTTTVGATIYYTTDGNPPTMASTVYAGQFTLSQSATIKTIAVKSGLQNSDVSSASFTINVAQVAAPTISPNGGSFASPQSVTLSTTTSGADIYYTTDGSTPTIASTKYTQGFTLTQSVTVKAISLKQGMTNSVITTANFVFTTPTIAFGPTLQDITYTYDSNGNIIRIVDDSQTNSAKTVDYTYDNLNRLISSTTSSIATGQQPYLISYTYDFIGNITSRSEKIGTTPTITYNYLYQGNQGSSYANPHAITSISDGTTTVAYLYDNNGNLTSAGTQTYIWNYRNEMVSVKTGGTTTNYGYDPSSQRIQSSDATYPTKWYNIDNAGKITKHIFAGSIMVATIQGTNSAVQVYTNHTDHLTSQGVTSSANGAAVEVIDYYPYGVVRLDDKAGSFSEQRKYSGHEYDNITGFSYMGARYYNGVIGRFLSQDPAFLLIGDNQFEQKYSRPLQLHLTNPQSLNSYSYAHNNPLAYKDENGEILPLIAAVGVAIWAVAEVSLSIYDAYSTYQTIRDSNASFGEKATSVGLFGLGLVGPGGGYKTLGGKIDDSAKWLNNSYKSYKAVKDSTQIAEKIADGHSYAKHVLGVNNPLGKEFGTLIKSREEYASYIKSVIDNPSDIRQLQDGRTAYYDDRLGGIVIHNPSSLDIGTAFRPDPNIHGYTNNYEYFKKGLK